MEKDIERSRLSRVSAPSLDLMARVYLWMTAGLAVTAAVSYAVTTSWAVQRVLFGSGVMPFLILVVLELGIVSYLSFRVMSMASRTASILFFAYAALNGLTLSPLVLAYARESVYTAFITCSATFAVTAAIGMITKRDLTELRSFLMMGLVGLIIAGIVNMFVGSSKAGLVISIFGVMIFVGLTIYDSNRIRETAASAPSDGDDLNKFAVIGALTLYLDFVNMFIYILRLMGRRK